MKTNFHPSSIWPSAIGAAARSTHPDRTSGVSLAPLSPAARGAARRRHRFLAPLSTYFICCVPRSGSWLLAEALGRTGFAGHPREYFRPDYRASFLAQWELPRRVSRTRFLRAVLDAGTTANAIFGAKLHWRQFVRLADCLPDPIGPSEIPDPAQLAELFPHLRFIWLRRADKERQAISYYRAIRSDVWWLPTGAAAPQSTKVPPVFDAAAIGALERLLIEDDDAWRDYFDRHRLRPLIIFYEDLARAPKGTVMRALRWLDVPMPADLHLTGPPLTRQADALSEQWLRRYRALKRSDRPATNDKQETRP